MPSQTYKLSCKSCRHRKIKCDRVHPCSNCQKSGRAQECVFPQPVRQPKARNAEITSRLSRLEKLVSSLGHDPATLEKHLAAQASSPESNSRSSDAGLESGVGNLQVKEYESLSKVDGTRYLSSEFWSSLSGEVDGLRQLLNEASDDEDEMESRSSRSLTGEEGSPGPQLFYDPNQKVDLLSMHPSTAHMSVMGNIFFSRVDPVFKLLHRPSTQAFIYAATRDKRAITKGQEALLFAIYFAAVTALTDQECLQNFGENKNALVQRHRKGIETALPNANFLDTSDITVLQALVIYLTSMRCYSEDRKAWTLFALACRIMQGMELMIDGATMKLPPFEIEMRRRLFWQIIVLDVSFAESRGVHPILTEPMFDTKQPLNISDEQLSPVTGIIGQEQEGGTEMTFSMQSQSASLILQIYTAMNPRSRPMPEEYQPPVEAREQNILQRLQEIKTKYVDRCDPSVPILWLSAETGRIIILRIWLLLQRPMYTLRVQTAKPAKREFILASAVSMLEMIHEVEHHPETRPWFWYMMGYVPWYPIAIILAELCVQTKGMLVDRAWSIMDKTYDIWTERVAESKASALWRPIKRMMDKARKARLERLTTNRNPAESDYQTARDWTNTGTLANESDFTSLEFKKLQYASVAQALGNPDELEAILSEQQLSPPTQLEHNVPMEDFAESVNWNDWDNFIQTAIDAENQNFQTQSTFLTNDFGLVNPDMSAYPIQQDKTLLPNDPNNPNFDFNL